jgi:hypothetical protein
MIDPKAAQILSSEELYGVCLLYSKQESRFQGALEITKSLNAKQVKHYVMITARFKHHLIDGF